MKRKLTKKQEAEIAARTLPVYKGYTIDIRLGQIRKVPLDDLPVFLDFDSEEGDAILSEFVLSLDKRKKRDKEILDKLFHYFISRS